MITEVSHRANYNSWGQHAELLYCQKITGITEMSIILYDCVAVDRQATEIEPHDECSLCSK